MGPKENEKKLNDEVFAFVRKRSETGMPRNVARLKSYVTLHLKRGRAAAARRNSEHGHNEKKMSATSRKKADGEQASENTEHPSAEDDRTGKSRDNKCMHRRRSMSKSHSVEPLDRCRRKRRSRRRRRRSRRRSCRRRRRSRRRRRCRRRRRSCSRRRRRRSCRRRRHRRRRRRC